MTPEALRALAERVEIGDATLAADLDITAALDWSVKALDYTTSVDAALQLLPPGTWAEGTLSSPSVIEVHSKTVLDPLGRAEAATPALAICAAALRARAAQGEDHE